LDLEAPASEPVAPSRPTAPAAPAPDAAVEPPKLGRRLLLGALFGLVVVAGFLAWGDVSKIRAQLATFAAWTVGAALALALGNYAIRFLRWQLYLKRLQVTVPVVDSALIYTAGFVMAVSPGKVGEILKSYLIRERVGTPLARTMPIVFAERLCDLLSLLLLALVGLRAFKVGGPLVVAGIGLVVVMLACIASRRLSLAILHLFGKLPLVRRVAHKLEEFYESTATLLAPVPLLYGTVLGAAAWLCECVGFYTITHGFRGAFIPLELAVFIYASTTVVGALSFLPGGLGVTEGSMAKLLAQSARGLDKAGATAAMLLTRLCTLWFAVGLGGLALGLLRRRLARVPSATRGGSP
jgi:uncharacterized protein (TIRG00374 family)